MARLRSVPDEALLDAALAILRRSGPAAVTFAAVGAATGLAPATLVQRFRSKPGLVKAALLRAWDLLDAQTEAAADAAPLSPQGAESLLLALSDYPEGDDFAEQLLILREDLLDAELRARGRYWSEQLVAALAPRLADAAGPREDLAREMIALWQGCLLWWAFDRNGTSADAVKATLGPWLRRMG